MPLYEYQCLKCNARIEKIQKFSDPPLETCERCGGKLERLLSTPAIQFKGSGWYVTDYARKSGPSETGSSAKPDGDSSGETKKIPATSPAKSPTDPKPSSS